MRRKAQFATEYLVVAAFMLLALMGGIYFIYNATKGPEAATVHAQMDHLGTTLVETAQDLYFLGQPSQVTLDTIFPRGMKNFTVYPDYPKELVIEYETREGKHEEVFISRVDLSSNINYFGRGRRQVVLQAKQDVVSICVVEDICNCDGICQTDVEDITTCATDCCTADCYGCSAGSNSSFLCTNDNFPHTECDGHNSCDCSISGC